MSPSFSPSEMALFSYQVNPHIWIFPSLYLLIQSLTSGDKQGVIYVQEAFGTRVERHAKVQSEVHCMAPLLLQGQTYLAIGYANGMIYIERIDEDLKMTTVHQMISGDDAVHALVWQEKANDTEWPFLASSYRHARDIHIWDVPNERIYRTKEIPHLAAAAPKNQRQASWPELRWSTRWRNDLFFTGNL